MTRHETFANNDISNKEMILATDLDGTFLGGTEYDRTDFYAWIEHNRPRIGLIFVTGRDPAFIQELVRNGLPRPEYVIGDVGTTIAKFDAEGQILPIETLEAEIATAWNKAGPKVEAALKDIKGLRLQPTAFRYRVSYDLDPAEFDETALDIIAEMGLEVLISDNRFLDVLPKGVSKGPSLLRLLGHLDVEPARTLVAGDTLNDLSMLELGLPAVAVGGSEPELVAQVADQDHVHCAQAVGVGGIAEAILKHALLSPERV